MMEQTNMEQAIKIENEQVESYIDIFIRIDKAAKELMEKKRAIIKEINDINAIANLSSNDTSYRIKLPLVKQNNDGTWTRISFKDNKEVHENGYYVFAWAERYTSKIDILKNKPK